MHALHAAQLQLLQVATVQVLEQYLPARHAAALIGEAKLLTVRASPWLCVFHMPRLFT